MIRGKWPLWAALAVLFLTLLPVQAAAKLAVVRQITIKSSPLSLELELDRKVPVKIIQLADNEVLVALRPARMDKDIKISGQRQLKLFSVAQQEGNVVAMVVTGKSPYKQIRSRFTKDGRRLTVRLNKKPGRTVPPIGAKAPSPKAKPTVIPPPKAAEPKPAPPGKALAPEAVKPVPPDQPVAVSPDPPPAPVPKKKDTPEAKKKDIAGLTAPPPYVPPKRTKTNFEGDVDDLYRRISRDPCQADQLNQALALIKRKSYAQAHALLEQYISQENHICLEQVHYLKAWTFFKQVTPGDFVGLMDAERKFQDALVLYPQSSFVPYGFSAIGLIQQKMQNLPAAEGYFNIVHEKYPGYTGMPEIMYHLAAIYDAKGYTDKAMRYYKQVFEDEIQNSYIPEAGVGYGKTLYQKQQYFNALRIFDHVVKLDLKKIYENPDLLLYRANANFELGLSRAAREQYMRVLNLFDDVMERDLILSKVGDTYGMEDEEAKAIKIYELVRERYPDTQGYINASIGLARYMDSDEDKIGIYTMIKARFPDNTYSRIAMMRLAEIYQKQGEYNKCIQEIEDLLSTHPKGLRYEAVKLMQKAYEALFKEQLKEDGFTVILNRYETEYVRLDKMGSRSIEFSVGSAYLEAGLWEEAFNHLMNAYKQYKRAKRSPELLYRLGVAMDESGRDKDAARLFTAFVKQYKTHKDHVDALVRMGHIYDEKGELDKASAQFISAAKSARDVMERGRILVAHAKVAQEKSDLKTAAALRLEAVKAFAEAPGKNYEILTQAYKDLGNTYLGMKSYAQAADAFAKALDLSQGEENRANLGFLLGDAYQKGNILNKAKEVFEEVAVNYDSVWARLARQRLSTLDLAQTVKNS